MPTQISETRQVKVQTDTGAYVFEADPDEGRLVLREQDEKGREVCAITMEDREQLSAFVEGLRRVFRPELSGLDVQAPRLAAPPTAREAAAEVSNGQPDEEDDASRDEVIERARTKNPNAFQPWTRREEQEVAKMAREGVPIEQIAREKRRSKRAIQMRLERMGVAAP